MVLEILYILRKKNVPTLDKYKLILFFSDTTGATYIKTILKIKLNQNKLSCKH